jgi:hypothetical protein
MHYYTNSIEERRQNKNTMTDPEINLGNDIDIPLQAETAVSAVAVVPSAPVSPELDSDQIRVLQEQCFPLGLACEMGNSKIVYPYRFWVVDNSGSMRASDGLEIRGSSSNIVVVPCTRWVELQGTVEYHAELAGVLEAKTTFRMLNDPGTHIGPQEFAVPAEHSTSIAMDVDRAKTIIRNSEPNGVTPLSAHVLEIANHIKSILPTLKSQGQRVVVVLATDGLPSNDYGESSDYILDEFVRALKTLQTLPVWVVIRLCTNDDTVGQYYNDLDKVLESPLEVIDDFFGEAKGIYAANKWLNYALPLHRCREMGYHHRIFDLLDERLLNKDELLEFLQILFGRDHFEGIPDMHAHWAGFANVLKKIVEKQGSQFNPITKKLGPWIDMKVLNKVYGKKSSFSLFGCCKP